MNIYKPDGDILIQDAPLLESAEHVQELSKSDYIKLVWSDNQSVTLPVGAYITYEGVKYSILQTYYPVAKDELEFSYEPEFQHPMMILAHTPFVLKTNNVSGEEVYETDWTFTGTLNTILNEVSQIIKAQTGITLDCIVNIEESTIDASATLSFSGVDIMTALNSIASEFDIEFHVDWDNGRIYFGDIYLDTPIDLIVGQNAAVSSMNTSNEVTGNCFIVRGGTRNITTQTASGNNVETDTRLSLEGYTAPDGIAKGTTFDKTSTIDTRTDKTNEPKVSKILIFDKVYPHLNLYVYNVRRRERRLKDEDENYVVDHYDDEGNPVYKKYSIYYVRLAYPTYDSEGNVTAWTDFSAPKSIVVDGKTLTASFEPNELGAHSELAGREFKMNYHTTDETITPNKTIEDTGVIYDDGTESQIYAGDYEINFEKEGDLIIPNTNTLEPWGDGKTLEELLALGNNALKNDVTILFNIVMTSDYMTQAKSELYKEACKEIKRLNSDLNNYTLKTYANEVVSGLSIGRRVRYEDASGSLLETRIIKLVTKLDYPSVVEITVGNSEIKGNTQTLREEVKSANDNLGLMQELADVVKNKTSTLTNALNSVLETMGKFFNLFLRKDQDDETPHKLTMASAEVKGDATIGGTTTVNDEVVKGNLASSNYDPGAPLAGSGWKIDREGNIEGESIKVRGFMEVPEIRFNRAGVNVGTNIQSECGGVIKTVTPESSTTGIASLELGDDDIAGAIQVGDLCWGYWHDIDIKSNNATKDTDDLKGEINYQGFATVYFQISEILNSNSTRFRYELRPDLADDGQSQKYPLHPYEGMHFGGRGNNELNEDGTPKYPSRQGFTMSTPRYTATYQYVGSWDWSEMTKYVTYVSGLLDGFEVVANETPGTWSNNWGTILGNVYYRGKIIEVSGAVRNMYITQSSNGVLQADEEKETVSIVIRDARFADKTSDFDIYVNKIQVYSKGSTKGCSLTYDYKDLSAGVNRFSVRAEGTRQVQVLKDGVYVPITEKCTIESSFVIRKEAAIETTMQIDYGGDSLIALGEVKTITFKLTTNTGFDVTDSAYSWLIERGSYDEDGKWTQTNADKVWGAKPKAKTFDMQSYVSEAKIALTWSSDLSTNDIDDTKDSTTYRITATVGEKEVQTTLEI